MSQSSQDGQNNSIPQFGLYGESQAGALPEFVHIENIADRSRSNDWLIKPHRHGRMYQLLWLHDGEAEVRLDDALHQLTGNWAISIPPGCVHGFHFRADTQGMVLTVVEPLLGSDARSAEGDLFSRLFTCSQLIPFQAGDALLPSLLSYLELIRQEFRCSDAGHVLMLEWLVKMVWMTLVRQLAQMDINPGHSQKSGNVLGRFRTLLEAHYREHWTVQQYADALHVSVSSLGRLCREQGGTNVKAVIQERLLLEAKRRLIYTRAPLDQVAYQLGFKDPAYFSRFFRQQEGMPPSDYRRIRYGETGTD